MSKLGFDVYIRSIQDDNMMLDFIFDNPLSISIGKRPDIMNIKFVEPSLFISKETGKALPAETLISKTIPKQFPD